MCENEFLDVGLSILRRFLYPNSPLEKVTSTSEKMLLICWQLNQPSNNLRVLVKTEAHWREGFKTCEEGNSNLNYLSSDNYLSECLSHTKCEGSLWILLLMLGYCLSGCEDEWQRRSCCNQRRPVWCKRAYKREWGIARTVDCNRISFGWFFEPNLQTVTIKEISEIISLWCIII